MKLSEVECGHFNFHNKEKQTCVHLLLAYQEKREGLVINNSTVLNKAYVNMM